MHFSIPSATQLALSLLWISSSVQAKDVFAHYMVGTVFEDTDHIEQDIQQAQDLGFKGFALNVGQPGATYAKNTVKQLFEVAAGKDFQFFFSMDMYQNADPNAFTSMIQDYASSDNYYKGPNSKPFLSTFSAGGNSVSDWSNWLSQTLPGGVYFVPMFDNTYDYYNNIGSWLQTWGSLVNGVFSWEQAWPGRQEKATNVTTEVDERILDAIHEQDKSYMIALSSLQYKHLAGTDPSAQNLHYYRVGETNLPERMTQILALENQPEFVQVLTWNDAGEGHYISNNLWKEGIPQDQLDYANAEDWPHAGWMPLVKSFITAYKAGKTADEMAPPEGDDTPAVGAMWYRSILTSANCGNDPLGKPLGWQAAKDAVNWAVVLRPGQEGFTVRTTSGGREIGSQQLSCGLNYGSVPGLNTGEQLVEVLDGSGNTVLRAEGVKDVTADTDGICNFNYQVAGLK